LEACNEAQREQGPVAFDCRDTIRFDTFGVALLASTASLRRVDGRQSVLLPPTDDQASQFMSEVELGAFVAGKPTEHGTVAIREMHALDPTYTHNITEILTRGVPGMTEENSYPIQLCLNELLQNVFEWSHSRIGCTALARWFRRTRSVSLAVVDRGIGIPAALRREKIQGLHRASDADVIVAAVTTPQLTSRRNRVGGLGLKTIRDVACGRGGRLTVLSLSAKVVWSGDRCTTSKSPPLSGTAVVIEFRPDAPFDSSGYVSVF
jgi:hypothetical protein